MYKIGMIDYFLDEWHAQNYPKWITEASEGTFKVCYAYADSEDPSGKARTNQTFCDDLGIELLTSIEDLIERSDAIIVLSPDHPEHHVRLSQLALESGKPVYIDKTFANTTQEATEMFELAKQHQTPMFSTSALRYASAYQAIPTEGLKALTTTGAGTPYNYLVHQLEPIMMLTKTRAKRALAWGTHQSYSYLMELDNGIEVMMSQHPRHTFTLTYDDGSQVQKEEANDPFFQRFIEAMLHFFEEHLEGRTYEPFDPSETMAVIEAREMLLQALRQPGEWVTRPKK